MNGPRTQSRNVGRRGTVLIVTMWVVLVLAGLTLVFAHSMRVEAVASANGRAALEADAVARGGLEFARAVLDGTDGSTESLQELVCEQRAVGGGLFWLLQPDLAQDEQFSFGFTDETSRINLNSASRDMLLKLPGMTAELADSAIDWRDRDANVSPSGAESEYYLLLDTPYYCKDASLETVSEVMLVRGATADMLYGEDTNRNGVLDENENDADESAPADDSDGALDPGFADFVTVWSSEPNVSADGEQRINVNERDSQELTDALAEVVEGDRIFDILENVRRRRPYGNILEFYSRSGLTMEEFAQVADRLTTSNDEELVGLVNVNTAPSEVLLCLPELDESDVDALLAARAEADTGLSGVAWVADALPREKAVAIGGSITGRSYQFSVQIVAVSGDGRAYRRYQAVLDARETPPRVMTWHDLTHLGWPLDPEIRAQLRRGSFEPTITTSTN